MVEIKNLTCSYSDTAILKDINLSLPEREIISIIGPNGSGKSTFLHALSRLISMQNGKIIIDGKNISDYKRKELAKKIALLPQFREVPDVSVRRFVLSGRYPYLNFSGNYSDKDEFCAKQAMDMTGITHLADRSLKSLSGGERQRVYIALCLSQGADILLLDEPTTYLDIRYQFDILDLIRSLTDKTVVAVLHDITHALTYSDKVILMDKGTVLAYGTPQEVASSGLIDEVFGITLDKTNYTISPK